MCTFNRISTVLPGVDLLDDQLHRLVNRDDQRLDGATVTLGDSFDGEKPVMLTLVYYTCPLSRALQIPGQV